MRTTCTSNGVEGLPITATLITAQTAASRIPYFHLQFVRNSTNAIVADYSCSGKPYDTTARLEYLRFTELPYASGISNGTITYESTMILRNYDCTIPDLRGLYIDIGVGDVTSVGNEYCVYPRMWVKHQTFSSSPGNLTSTIILEGWAEALDEEHARISNDITDPMLYYVFNRDHTPYAIMAHILASGVSANPFTLNALTVDDGMINTFLPFFEINAERNRYESKLDILTSLLYMTKCYLKPLAAKQFNIVYPQDSDSADLTITSDIAPWFYEFNEVKNEIIPNHIYVFCNNTDAVTTPPNYNWPSLVIGQAQDTDSYARYGYYVAGLYQAPLILTQTDANNRASAILARIKSESVTQGLVMPHDCRIELYDHLLVRDKRGRSSYNDTKVRVSGLTHTYSRSKGIMRLSIYGGGLANFPMMADEPIPIKVEKPIYPDPSKFPQYEPSPSNVDLPQYEPSPNFDIPTGLQLNASGKTRKK